MLSQVLGLYVLAMKRSSGVPQHTGKIISRLENTWFVLQNLGPYSKRPQLGGRTNSLGPGFLRRAKKYKSQGIQG